MSKPTKILIVGPSWVGDMVMAQSLFLALKAQNPDYLIHVLAPDWSLPLLQRMPEVAKTIINPLAHGEFNLVERYHIGLSLRDEGYDQAIVLPNSWKSALIPFFAKIPKRTGYIGECRFGLLNDARKLDKQKLTMTVQRFIALAYFKEAMKQSNPFVPSLSQRERNQEQINNKSTIQFQTPKISANPEGQAQVIEKFSLNLDKKILALCPGAEYGPSKRWPPEHFAEVALTKLQQGWQVWLMGSEKDKPSAEEINKLTDNLCLDFIGKTSLTEAIDLLSLADTVIANDSGLMHLAAALGKKIIAIYGSTPPDFAPPLSDKAYSVSLNLPCSPCRKRICPLYPADHARHTECLSGIKPERILELIDN